MVPLPTPLRIYRPIDRTLNVLGRLKVRDTHPAMVVRNRLNTLLFRTVFSAPAEADIMTLDGFTLRVRCNDQQSASIMFENRYSPDETLVLRRELAGVDLFIDVGSNYGYFTMLAASVGVAHVIAVEPNPDLVPFIRQSAELNGFDVTVIEAAVSETPGIVQLEWDDRMSGSGRIGSEGHNVEATTLDEILDQAPAGRVVAKIDIEGHEVEALRGAGRLFDAKATILC